MTKELAGEFRSNNYFYEINYFRGVSIFFIVWGHILGLLYSIYPSSAKTQLYFFYRTFGAVVQGDTAFFVFISGFLFYKVFYLKGFNYKVFVKSKVLKVLLPWFIITTFFYFI